jgi:hypothetical protein
MNAHGHTRGMNCGGGGISVFAVSQPPSKLRLNQRNQERTYRHEKSTTWLNKHGHLGVRNGSAGTSFHPEL